jgi:hypothetical protein
MPVDTSFYNTKAPEPFNPLKTLGDVTAISNAMQQNQALQLGNKLTQAKFALGKYYEKNTLPNGEVNYNGLQSDVASDPQTAMLLPQIQTEGRAALAPVTQFNPATQQTELMSTQAQQSSLNPRQNLLARQQDNQSPAFLPQITQDDIDQAHDNLDYLGKTTQSLLGKPDLSTSDILDNATDLAAEWTKSKGKRGVSPQQLANTLGTIPAGKNGSDASPQQLHKWLQQHYDTIMQSKAAITATHGLPSPQKTNDQSLDNQWSSPHVAVSNPSDYGTRLENSQARIKQVTDEATAAPTQLAPFNKVLQLANDIQTGAGADQVNKIRNFLVTAGVASDKMNNETATFEELKKYLNGIQATAGEGKTNQYLDLLNSANPNDKLLPKTIENVARFGAAQLQGKIAKQAVLQNSLGKVVTPEAEEKFNKMWNSTYDPRAIELNMMPPDQQAEYLKKLSKTDKKKILDSFDLLHQGGALR